MLGLLPSPSVDFRRWPCTLASVLEGGGGQRGQLATLTHKKEDTTNEIRAAWERDRFPWLSLGATREIRHKTACRPIRVDRMSDTNMHEPVPGGELARGWA